MNNILFVDNFKLDFDNPMSTLYVLKCNKISQQSNVSRLDITGNNIEDYFKDNKYSVILLGQRCPDFYKCNKLYKKIIKENLDKLFIYADEKKIKKFMFLQDTHPKTYGSLDNLTNFINLNKLNLIFTFYENSESRHIRNKCSNLNFFHLPHHIDTNIFNSCNENRDNKRAYDIILYGDIHPTHYPFRKRLFELLLANAEMRNFKILHLTPPVDSTGKNKVFDPNKCEKGLAQKIRSAKFAIATKSKYDYFVAKYLEIAVCETVVIGDMATDALRLDKFKDNYIKIDNRMTDNEILDIISEAISNYDVSEICKNRAFFAKYIFDNYDLDSYIQKLFKIFSKSF